MIELDSVYNSRCGAKVIPDNPIKFKVWAPYAEKIDLLISKGNGGFESYKMRKALDDDDNSEKFCDDGLYSLTIPKSKRNNKLFHSAKSNKKRPDPTSNFQPFGVDEESRAIDHLNYKWRDKGMEKD